MGWGNPGTALWRPSATGCAAIRVAVSSPGTLCMRSGSGTLGRWGDQTPVQPWTEPSAMKDAVGQLES